MAYGGVSARPTGRMSLVAERQSAFCSPDSLCNPYLGAQPPLYAGRDGQRTRWHGRPGRDGAGRAKRRPLPFDGNLRPLVGKPHGGAKLTSTSILMTNEHNRTIYA